MNTPLAWKTRPLTRPAILVAVSLYEVAVDCEATCMKEHGHGVRKDR